MDTLRCAWLTMADPGDFVTDYHLGIAPMEALGWRVTTVNWRARNNRWDDYDAVYICTPWDYPEHISEFLDVLARIDGSRAILVNALELVHWSLVKSYLRDLESRGACIVPSRWHDDIDGAVIDGFFDALASDTVVVKPLIGANAADTFVVRRPVEPQLRQTLLTTFSGRRYIVQPFLDAVVSEGEYSLFYFGDEYSHAIVKTPKQGDFRVQEEHGADIVAVTPTPELIDVANGVLSLVAPQPVYARADFVRDARDRYCLMELELIEPSLYLRMDNGAPARFANAFDAHVRKRLAD
ncbi:MAG: hypothetical protein R3288_09665 [Woeseiaceae bacterium]|nr:hypothetical protein [Woeseiaceae bacterium]